jgi:predicted glycosyltransferase
MTSESRLLIYSHDSFGLGHLRRCRAIAHDLVARYRDLSVLILSGSPIIGSFDFKSRVDFVRVPGVIKLRNGEYTSLKLHIDIDRTVAIRSSIVKHTAEVFEPDLFIVDKEPLGLRGEVRATLEMLRARGTRCILGLRDVMDDPGVLVEEWERKNVFPALDELYDEIWVYGLPEIFDPVAEVPGFARLAHKMRFTGYLRREAPAHQPASQLYNIPEEPFILVTTGGGGDGGELVDWVIRAYESEPDLPYPAVILFGPFLPAEQRAAFQERVDRIPALRASVFESNIELLFERAAGIVAMGGYNTFCEILSFGKPALVVPRTEPRLEQYLRADRAQRLGLLRMLPFDGKLDARRMAYMLRTLPYMPVASEAVRARMLGGLDEVARLAGPWLAATESIDALPVSLRA